MKKKIALFLFLGMPLLFHSCSTDFNVIAPYREMMVIYCFLNSATNAESPGANTHYVRISKAYLGEGNSLMMAQEKDSVNYGDVLDVKMQRLLNGAVTNTYILTRDTTIPKDDGIFYSPYQVFYTFNAQLSRNDGSIYKLIVHNNKTGVTATAKTNVVGSIDLVTGMTIGLTSIFPASVQYNTGQNAWVYAFTIRFHYKEVVLANPQDTVSKFVDWNFGDRATGSNPPPSIEFDNINRSDIYRIIGNKIPPADTNVIRRIIPPNPSVEGPSSPIELILTAGTEDLYTYQQLTKPSFGVVQERPAFSNIENGLGLFTSRFTRSDFKNMDGPSRAAFDTSRYTKAIHFIH